MEFGFLTVDQKATTKANDSGAFPPHMWNGQTGLFTAQGPEEVPHAIVAWADDVVILGSDADATHIVDKLQYTCSIMVQELLRYGLQPNFKDGKTEAIIDPRGNFLLRLPVYT